MLFWFWRRKLSSRPVRTFQVYFLLLLLPPLASPIFFSILESSPPTHSDSHFSSLHRMYFSCSSSLPFASPSIFPIPSVCRALKGGGGTALPPPSTLKVRQHRGFSTLLLSSATKLPLRIYTCNKNCESYDHDHRSSKI